MNYEKNYYRHVLHNIPHTMHSDNIGFTITSRGLVRKSVKVHGGIKVGGRNSLIFSQSDVYQIFILIIICIFRLA